MGEELQSSQDVVILFERRLVPCTQPSKVWSGQEWRWVQCQDGVMREDSDLMCRQRAWRMDSSVVVVDRVETD